MGLRRKEDDLKAWKKRDPIERLVKALVARGDINWDDFDDMVSERRAEVRAALKRARAAPYPDPGTLVDYVYATPAEIG